jgi:two-component system NtrC family sensor kinase
MSILRSFANPILPFLENDSLSTVADAFLHPDYKDCLSIAVVNQNYQPVGMISRHQLTDVFLKKFGRDLFGNRPVKDFMRQRFCWSMWAVVCWPLLRLLRLTWFFL